ncbi:MAG: GIY-YIG nuclease family protein [Candidatus Magasanikbacteria bacterium]|jgi:putative endonuclease|nr:GIY-YIG nuclease family protein [Candidatus Magasanikbacteria bacterium]
MYTVYILSCTDGSLYTGIAKDLESRLAVHRSGKGAKYVRARLPITLVYSEKCTDRSAALKREWQIKQFSKEQKQQLITRLGIDKTSK